MNMDEAPTSEVDAQGLQPYFWILGRYLLMGFSCIKIRCVL